MMKRGKRPKPVAVQIAEGDPRKHGVHKLEQRLAAEPKAPHGYGPPPKHLKGLARETWDFLAEQIEIMGLDRRPDGQMLEGACISYARAVRADAEVELHGITFQQSKVDPESGAVIPLKITKNPAVSVSKEAWLLFYRFACEFGLSPISRTRLSMQKTDKPAEDLMDLLSMPREKRTPQGPVN